MSQANIDGTLRTILDQLHGTGNNSEQKEKLTAVEIAQIFSGQSEKQSKEEHQAMRAYSQSELFQIDMKSFDLELQEVNNHWQLQYYRPINCYRKLIAKLIVFGKKVVRKLLKFLIEPLVEEQVQFNIATVQALNSIRNHHVVFQSATNYLCSMTRQNGHRQDELKAELDQVHGEICEQMDTFMRKIQKEDVYDGIDYFKFQEQMRGSIDDIKDRQMQYLPYFESCSRVIDLGCGRGEFLEDLRDHGIYGIGVDAYDKSVKFCRKRDLQVVEGDAIEFLSQQETNSVDGVFSAQLVEHLSPGKVLQMCRESYRVMRPGSYIVLETPNPMSLSIYMKSFYIDPTHKNPVHPKLLEYYLRESGFCNIQVLFPPNRDNFRFPLLDADYCKNLDKFNDGVNLLSDTIFGSEDYAIVAQK